MSHTHGLNDHPDSHANHHQVFSQRDEAKGNGTGTDVAIEAADVVLMSGSLTGVPNAIALSRATIGNIRQNLFWASRTT